jgi:hypothetical protein
MLLAYICNVIMVAFVLDSSSTLEIPSRTTRLTWNSDAVRSWKAHVERSYDSRFIPRVQCCVSNDHWVSKARFTDMLSTQRNLLAAIFFCAATGLAKGSILLFYLRIFPGRYIIIIVWSLFAFVIGYSLAGVFANIFSCNPVSASWVLEDVAKGVCMNRPAFYFAQAALGIFTDIATVLTPIPLLRGLQLRTRRKIGVAFVLTLGGL